MILKSGFNTFQTFKLKGTIKVNPVNHNKEKMG